ncbi:MAG: type II secretion system F family protein [Magnetococcus sp. XQGC-1]
MLGSGASIPDSLDEISSSATHPRFREAVISMMEDIKNGKGFSESMLDYPDVFPVVFTSLVRVGERTGRLGEVFRALGGNLKWEDELVTQARRAVRYPMFVGGVVLGLFFFLMIYLAPKLIRFIPNMGGTIPWYTEALFVVSGFIVEWWWLVLVAPTFLLLGLMFLRRLSSTFALVLDGFFLRVWFFGPLLQKIFLVRFTTNFALMYRAGVPVLEILKINETLTNNRAIAHRVQTIGKLVADGLSIGSVFRRERLFPPPLPRLIEAGELSGQLDTALDNVSYFLDRDVRDVIGGLQSLVEPVLTVFTGMLLGWVIFSVLGPIYDTISRVQF